MKQSRFVLALVAAVAVTTTALGPALARAARPQAGFQGTITVYAEGLMPPGVQKASPGQAALPHMVLGNLAHQWERAHPGVHIVFDDIGAHTSDTNFLTVLRTQLTGGTAPDAFTFFVAGTNGGSADLFTHQGLVLDIGSYMSQPNPYIPGNKHWIDSFLPPWQSLGRLPGGGYAGVPLSLVPFAGNGSARSVSRFEESSRTL